MKFRFWHPMRDQFHALFRFVRIAEVCNYAMTTEKLFILDMYMLFPSLLHKCSMQIDMKSRFRSLNVSKPDEIFISLPSSQSIYREMRPYQRSALIKLVAIGSFEKADFLAGRLSYQSEKVPLPILEAARTENTKGQDLVDFIVRDFGGMELSGAKGLLHSTNLPHRIM